MGGLLLIFTVDIKNDILFFVFIKGPMSKPHACTPQVGFKHAILEVGDVDIAVD